MWIFLQFMCVGLLQNSQILPTQALFSSCLDLCVRPVTAPSFDGLIITLQWLTKVFAPVSESTSGTSEGGHTGRDVSISECERQREPLVQNCQKKS